jgi:hypothetical protein
MAITAPKKEFFTENVGRLLGSPQSFAERNPAKANNNSPPIKNGVMYPAKPNGLTKLQTSVEITAIEAPILKPNE